MKLPLNVKLLLKLFEGLYILGIVAALVIATSPLYAKLLPSGAEATSLLLPVSVGHVVLLALVGWVPPRPYNLVTGEKVQTAGYLHTLIGFSATLLLMNSESAGFATVLQPLGSALLTSVFGWFLGGQIVGRGAYDVPKTIESESERVAAVLKITSASLGKLNKRQEAVIKKATEVAEQLSNKLAGQFLDQVKKLGTSIQDINQGFAGAATAVRETLGESFQNDMRTIKEFSSSIVQEMQGIEEASRNIKNDLTKAVQPGEQIPDLLRDFAQAIKSAQAEYKEGLTTATQAFNGMSRQHVAAVGAAADLVGKLSEALEPLQRSMTELAERVLGITKLADGTFGVEFQATLDGLGDRARAIDTAFESAAAQANSAAQYLEQTRILHQELERVFERLSAVNDGP